VTALGLSGPQQAPEVGQTWNYFCAPSWSCLTSITKAARGLSSPQQAAFRISPYCSAPVLNVTFCAMCLAIPGKITSISGDDPLIRTGKIDFGGISKEACLAYVPEARIGDYVIVHVGFAISRLDEEEANKVFEYLREMEDLSELEERATVPGVSPPGQPHQANSADSPSIKP
jgi:hydrogenase expression/formation protein HypC